MGWGESIWNVAGWLGFGDRKPRSTDVKPASTAPKRRLRPSRDTQNYSRSYNEIMAMCHNSPPPILGAPALIWHIGLWPGGGSYPLSEALDPDDYEAKLGSSVNIVQGVLDKLERKGRNPAVPEGVRECLKLREVESLEEEDGIADKGLPRLYKVVSPDLWEALRFGGIAKTRNKRDSRRNRDWGKGRCGSMFNPKSSWITPPSVSLSTWESHGISRRFIPLRRPPASGAGKFSGT